MSSPPTHEPPKTQPVDLTGTVLSDRYRVLKQLGAGGMGTVYLGEHITIHKKLAIKVLSPSAAQDPTLVERFLREARATSLISHQHVIEISDFGDMPDGSVFFVMEYLDGEDLRTLLKREKRLPWPRVRHLLVQVCRALEAAHAAGVVHRDMKPDNCFRVTRGAETDFIKVLDFGIAKVTNIGTEEKGLTKTGMIFGTAEYMSPEQAQGNSNDPRVDVYGVGVIMYELLCGRVPFKGKNFARVLIKHLYDAPTPPSERAPDANIPPEAEAIVLKALTKDPANRFQSMAEMIAAIEAVGTGAPAVEVARENIIAPDTSGPMTFGAQTPTPALTPAAAPEELGSLRGLWIGLGGLALTGGLVALVLFGGLSGASGDEQAQAQAGDSDDRAAEVAAPPTAAAPVSAPAPVIAPADPSTPPVQAPALSKLHFETNVPARILDASDRTLYGQTDDEAGIDLPMSEEPIALLLEADGYEELAVEVVPNGETKRYDFELAKSKSKGGKRSRSGKGGKHEDAGPKLPSREEDSELKNPFAK